MVGDRVVVHADKVERAPFDKIGYNTHFGYEERTPIYWIRDTSGQWYEWATKTEVYEGDEIRAFVKAYKKTVIVITKRRFYY